MISHRRFRSCKCIYCTPAAINLPLNICLYGYQQRFWLLKACLLTLNSLRALSNFLIRGLLLSLSLSYFSPSAFWMCTYQKRNKRRQRVTLNVIKLRSYKANCVVIMVMDKTRDFLLMWGSNCCNVLCQIHDCSITWKIEKVHSYYTAIALQWRYIDYFLSQFTTASPHFKLKWIYLSCNTAVQ